MPNYLTFYFIHNYQFVLKYFAKNITFLRTQKGYTQEQIGHQLGIKRTTWNGYEKGTSQPYVDVLVEIAKYFGISEGDLLHVDLARKGNLKTMSANSTTDQKSNPKSKGNSNLRSSYTLNSEDSFVVNQPTVKYGMPQVVTIDTEGNENVVLVPVRARAGYLSGYSDPEFMAKLPAYRLPGLNNGTFRLFEVEGLSMYPTLHGGDLIIGSMVEQLRDIRDDRLYVVVTKNEGVVVKRVLNRLQKDGKLILKSDNYKERDMYPPIVADPDDIIEVWYATGFISRQMRPPAEMYNRLIDLEGRLTLLEDQQRKNLPK